MKEKSAAPIYQLIDAILRWVLRQVPPSRGVEKLALWWGYRYCPPPRKSRLRSGNFIWTTQVDHLQLLIYYLGTFEPYCLPYVRKVVGSGGTVLDVGANIGLYSIESAAAVGPNGRVVAIEAASSHVDALRQNIELNSLENVSVFETAVGAAAGHATLKRMSGDNLGMFSLGQMDGVDEQVVSVRTIDDVILEAKVSSLDLIKMDIEGSEYGALVGAEKTVRSYLPAILIELNDIALHSCGSSSDELVKLLHGWGYLGWEIGRGFIRPIQSGGLQGQCIECIFVHSNSNSLLKRLKLI